MVKGETLGDIVSPTQTAERKKKKVLYLIESGQHAKVATLFANRAHMETPQLTFTNLISGLLPRALSVTQRLCSEVYIQAVNEPI